MYTKLQKNIDDRGCLTVLDNLPFKPKRVFYVSDVPKGEIRGKHAHYRNKQILICISGIIEVKLDTGKTINTTVLHEGESIFVNALVWDEQKYCTGNDILLSICSEDYDPADYIKDYNRFKIIADRSNSGPDTLISD